MRSTVGMYVSVSNLDSPKLKDYDFTSRPGELCDKVFVEKISSSELKRMITRSKGVSAIGLSRYVGEYV